MLFDERTRAFPQIHVSSRLSRKVASSVDVGIVHNAVSNIYIYIAHDVGGERSTDKRSDIRCQHSIDEVRAEFWRVRASR